MLRKHLDTVALPFLLKCGAAGSAASWRPELAFEARGFVINFERCPPKSLAQLPGIRNKQSKRNLRIQPETPSRGPSTSSSKQKKYGPQKQMNARPLEGAIDEDAKRASRLLWPLTFEICVHSDGRNVAMSRLPRAGPCLIHDKLP